MDGSIAFARWRQWYPVKTSHCQNVPQSKRLIVKPSPVKTSRFETKRPRWSKRSRSKRTNANDLMQWLHSVADWSLLHDCGSLFKQVCNDYFVHSLQITNLSVKRANVPSWEGTWAPPGEYDWTCASFGPPESTTQTANRSVQPFLSQLTVESPYTMKGQSF